MSDDLSPPESALGKAQDLMEDGHSKYLLGIAVLALVALLTLGLVAYVIEAVMQVVANPSSASSLNLGWVGFASVLLFLGGLFGSVMIYFGIHEFMTGTRRAMDWLVTLRERPTTSGEALEAPRDKV